MIKKMDYPFVKADIRTPEEKKADFSKYQKRIVDLMDEFKQLNMNDLDHITVIVYEKSFLEALDCIEGLCENLRKVR